MKFVESFYSRKTNSNIADQDIAPILYLCHGSQMDADANKTSLKKDWNTKYLILQLTEQKKNTPKSGDRFESIIKITKVFQNPLG